MKNVLFVAHRSVYHAGAEDDFERVIKYISEKGETANYGFLPDGPRVKDYSKYFKNYGLYHIGYLPVIYVSFMDYIKYIVKYFIQARQFREYMKENKIDLAYLNTCVMLWMVFFLKRKGVKIVVNIKETIEPEIIRKIVYKIYSRKCDYFFSVSGYNTKDFINLTADNRITTIYSAVEDVTGPEIKIEYEIGNENTLKLMGNAFKIINVGPVCKIKNQQIILHALNLLKQKGINNILYVQIGDVPDETGYGHKFNNIIKKYRIEDKVLLLGKLQIDTMRAVLNKCDALIISSVSEGLPLILVEAFKQRIPVLSTNNTGMSEIITHLENGLIYENNPEQLGEMIEILMKDKELSGKITNNAFNFYKEKFNLEKNLETIRAKFEELLKD